MKYKIYKCNQCGDTYLEDEITLKDKVDGPYCIYCVKEWENV